MMSLAGQRAADLDHLLLADGQIARGHVGIEMQPYVIVEDLLGVVVKLFQIEDVAVRAGEITEKYVFGDVELRRDGQLLINTGDAAAHGVAGGGKADGLAVDQYFAAVRRMRAGNDLDKRGFARAVLTAERVHFAGVDVKADVRQRDHAGEGLGDVL